MTCIQFTPLFLQVYFDTLSFRPYLSSLRQPQANLSCTRFRQN